MKACQDVVKQEHGPQKREKGTTIPRTTLPRIAGD